MKHENSGENETGGSKTIKGSSEQQSNVGPEGHSTESNSDDEFVDAEGVS